MACRSRSLLGLCLGAVLGGHCPLPAQAPAPAILGLLRDESGAPVVEADLAFVPDRLPDVPCARDVRGPLPAVSGQSDRRGAFRIAADRTGLLLATTTIGLGAVVERCWPNRAERLLLRPMAEIARADGQEIAVFPAIASAQGRRHLPTLGGRAVRLPAGRYEAWIREPEGWSWRELALRPGERTTLGPQAATRTLERSELALRPAGFAMIDWSRSGQDAVVLLGAASRAEWFVHPAATAVGAAATELFLTLERRGATWVPQPVLHASAAAAAPTGTSGRVVLGIRDDCAPGLLGAAGEPAGRGPAFEVGRTLVCRVWTPDRQPAPGIEIAFAPAADQPATTAACTDALGEAELRHVRGPGELRLDDPRWSACTIAIGSDDDGSVDIQLDLGLTLTGTVLLPDGSPAGGAAVTLRDATGAALLRERTLQAGADGAFAFAGLRPEQRVRVFAAQRRDQRMWRAELVAQSGAAGLRLVLRDEDPTLQPPDDR